MRVQTVWLTVVTIAIGRTRDKWPVENTLARLDGAVAETAARHFGAADFGWIALGIAGVALPVGWSCIAGLLARPNFSGSRPALMPTLRATAPASSRRRPRAGAA